MLDSSKLLSLILGMLNQQAPPKQQSTKPDASAVRETADEVIVTVEAPGIQTREDVSFSIGVTSLTMRGIRKKTAGSHPASTSHEITHEKFEKTFNLPFPVRPETATAFYSKGILEVRLKKLPEKKWEKVYIQFL